MKHIILPEENENLHYYKANLHCHSVISDGHLTPEELKKLYQEHGYSVLAYTDHDVFIPHNDLTDDTFVALNGMEYHCNEPRKNPDESRNNYRTCHICMIAKDPANKVTPVYTGPEQAWGNGKNYTAQAVYKETDKPYVSVYSGEAISAVMQEAHDEGFYVTYNHPDWSGEGFETYSKYRNMDAMEIVNGACIVEGYSGSVEAYMEMVKSGIKVNCICADDNHNKYPREDPCNDSFGGWIKLAAPSLSYANVIKALEDGLFFAGTGDFYRESPDFLSIVYDDETREVTVKAKNARVLNMRNLNGRSMTRRARAAEGETIDEYTFTVPEYVHTIQLVAISRDGKESYSNAICLNNLK